MRWRKQLDWVVAHLRVDDALNKPFNSHRHPGNERRNKVIARVMQEQVRPVFAVDSSAVTLAGFSTKRAR